MRLWEELIPGMHIVIQFGNYYYYYYHHHHHHHHHRHHHHHHHHPIYVSLGFWNVDGMVIRGWPK